MTGTTGEKRDRHSMTGRFSARGWIASSAADDSGIAMMLVIAMMGILFLLATMLLAFSFYTTKVNQQLQDHTKAVHVADAGLNAYLYELRRDSRYYLAHPRYPDAGTTAQDDGTWFVTAVPPAPGTPLTLTSTGYLTGLNQTATVMATVRFPTFADYMFLGNADINIGSDATIQGKVRSNGSINNQGIITGAAYAHGSITGMTGPNSIYGGVNPGSDLVDFSQVTADMSDIQAAATSAGSAFPASGALGYRVVVNGANYTVEKVTGGLSTGNLTTTSVRGSTPVPACGVLYFSDDVYVYGTYGTGVTICGSRDIYVINNYQPTTMNSIFTAGLIAQRNIIVPTWYPTVPNDMILSCALLAQSGSVYGDVAHLPIKNSITINGSNSYYTYGYFTQTRYGEVTGGFRTRYYNYDPRLDLYAPPRFPVVHSGALKVNTWVEGASVLN